MKHAFFAAVLCLTAFSSMADIHSPASMSVPQMPMTDSRCQITSSSTNLDYGLKSRWEMQDVSDRSQSVTPGKRQITISVLCPYTHDMRLKVMGDRNSQGGFRYGDSGELQVRVVNAQLDGNEVQIALSNSEGTLQSTPQETLTLLPAQTLSAAMGNQPAQGKAFIVRLEVQPVITDKDARVSSRQASESNLSFDFLD